jgi:hypothetical protein
MTGVIDVYLQVNKFWVVFYIIEVLPTCFLNRNVIIFLNMPKKKSKAHYTDTITASFSNNAFDDQSC